MNTEFEATFLETPHTEIRKRLTELGASCIHEKYDMKRVVYDYPDLRLDEQAAWIRIRQESDKITMGFKQRQSEKIDGMKEIEFEVSDYEEAGKFLEAIGLKVKASQESKRELWRLDDCEVMLDEWPWIPEYIEVEGPDDAAVKAVSEKLGVDYDKAVFDSTDAIYQHYFDVGRTEISTVPLVFSPIPDWLEQKRKATTS